MSDLKTAEMDETPIDEAWIESIGWEVSGDKGWRIYRSPTSQHGGPVCQIEWEPLMGCDGWAIGYGINTVLIPPLEFRWQVTSMCKALGITLQESEAK